MGSVSFLVGAGVMWTLSLLVGGTIISSASCSRVFDDEDPTSRFNHYDEMMYNDYEGQDPGGEWNSYNPVSNDMYMGGNGNGPQQKFGHSSNNNCHHQDYNQSLLKVLQLDKLNLPLRSKLNHNNKLLSNNRSQPNSNKLLSQRSPKTL